MNHRAAVATVAGRIEDYPTTNRRQSFCPVTNILMTSVSTTPGPGFFQGGFALAEALRYVPGRPLRSVTIDILKRDAGSACEVDPVVVRRALALAGAPRHLPAANS